jgi:hypothetical protein
MVKDHANDEHGGGPTNGPKHPLASILVLVRNVIKLLRSQFTNFWNKLKCLSLTSLSSLV